MPELTQAEQDRELVDRGRRGLTRQIVHRIETLDLDDKQIRHYAGALCAFQKVDLARERTAAQERMTQKRVAAMNARTEAMERIAEKKIASQERIADKNNATRLEIARLHAAASIERAKHRPNHPRYDKDDPSAPWGRKDDGTPVTHDEVRASLNEAIRDIYGLPPISGKSYMPDELQKMHERYPDDPRYWSPAQRRRKNNPNTPAPPAADPLHPK